MKFDAAHNYMVRYSLKANSGDAASLAAVTVASEERVNHEDAASARKYILPQPTAVGQETYLDMPLAANADDSITAYDKSFKFYAGSQAKAAAYTIKATLLKVDSKGAIVIGDKKYSEVDNVSSLVEVLDPTDVNNKLTYEAYLDEATTDNTILAADDYMDAGTGTVGAKTMVDNYRGFTKKVKVRVMKNGEKVSAPSDIVSVTSNNPQVAEASDADGSKYIAGGKEGKAIITVMYNNAKKEVQTSSLNVSTKNAGPEVKAISLKRTTKDVATADLQAGLYLWDAKMAEKLTVNDQFGGEFVAENHPGAFDDEGVYTDNDMVQASGQGFNNNAILKMSYYVSDVAGAKKEMVSVDANGIVKLDSAAAAGDVTSFQVNVMAPNGMQSSFTVTVK
jgi:hypothetical protein